MHSKITTDILICQAEKGVSLDELTMEIINVFHKIHDNNKKSANADYI